MEAWSRGKRSRIRRGSSFFLLLLLSCLVAIAAILLVPRVAAATYDASEEKAIEATRQFLEEFRDEFSYLKYVWKGGNGWDYCTEKHIQCDDSGIASLELSGLGLDGDFPELHDDDEGYLVKIKSINMSNNLKLDDDLEKEWGYLTHLQVIDVSGTRAEGKLPSEWSLLTNLRELHLSGTRVEGTLPANWRTMTQLRVLDLSGTAVKGSLPWEWSAMSNMASLNLASTSLSGTLPASWTNSMVNLAILNVAHTGISNVLTSLTSANQFPSLVSLDVSNPTNQVCGSLPSSFGDWAGTDLEQLNIRGYQNCGCLPLTWRSSAALVDAARLANMRLLTPTCAYSSEQQCGTDANRCTSLTFSTTATMALLEEFRSTFPDPLASIWTGNDYCTWKGIRCSEDTSYPGIAVDLSHFNLVGSIPTEIGSRLADASVYVESLTLSDNPGLLGEFPVTLDDALPLLRSLDLSRTGLFGPLPVWTNFAYLEDIDISSTSACMNLPAWERAHYPLLRRVDLSNNNLRGLLASSWDSFLAPDSYLTTLSLRGNAFCGCLPSALWRTHAVSAGALDSSTMAALSSGSCSVTNACGNINQQCSRGAAPSTSAEATLAFLQSLRNAFPNQLGATWTGNAYCSGLWVGVRCSVNAATQTQEVSIHLANSSLSGTLPQVPLGIIGSRVLVASMDFSDCHDITGPLPVSWGRLGYLRSLNLAGTHVGGHIPDDWTDLRSLESITIAKTRVCRGLPNWNASKMPNLRYVDFSSNYLIGGLSVEFGSFGNQLTHFDVSSNVFCGCVPDEWTGRVLLDEIQSSNPRMFDKTKCASETGCRASNLRCYDEGTQQEVFMDPSLAFLTAFRREFLRTTPATTGSVAIRMLNTWTRDGSSSLDDYCNGWEGVACDDLDGFSLNFSGTGLAGTLPSLMGIESASTIAVVSLDLSNNPGIQGTLPASWGVLHNVRTFSLAGTSLNSSVPLSWQSLSNLRSLSLARSGVCGPLPPWDAAQLAAIESLDFSNSKLSGTLTDSWGDFGLSRLANLDLSGNPELCQCVPEEWFTGYSLVDAVINAFGVTGSSSQCGNCPEPSFTCRSPDMSGTTGPNGNPSSSSGDGSVGREAALRSYAVVASLVMLFVPVVIL